MDDVPKNHDLMKPLFSVIIPTFNHAHFLGRALQSVVDQSYPCWEALVIDNHSTDSTDDVVSNFRDQRVRLLKIHNHGVIAASRNFGIREAKGDWVAFLDSDDYWYPQKLETIIAEMETDGNFDVFSNDELKADLKTGDKSMLRYGPYEKDFYKTMLLEGNRLSPSATVIRRTFLVEHGLGFGESLDYVTVEDFDLWLNLARTGARFKFIHEVLGEYVIHENNSSARLSQHLRNGAAMLHDHVFNIQQFHPSPDRLWKQVSIRLHFGQVKQFALKGQLGLAIKLVLVNLFNSPIDTARYIYSKVKRLLKARRQ